MSRTAYTLGLALLPLLRSVNGMDSSVPVFVDSDCSYSGDYTYFNLGSGYPSCTVNTFENTGFQATNGQYNATFLIPAPDEGCQIFVRAPSNTDDPGCGEVIAIFTQSECRTLTFPDPFDLNFCCGTDDCHSALNSKKARSLPEDKPTKARSVPEPASKIENIAALKARNPFLPKKRDTGNCAYGATADVYTTDGAVQNIGNTIDCTQPTCTDSFMSGVTTGSSQSYGVSESTEAGLFDIVSETVSFSYDYTYMTSTTVQQSFSYSISDGTQGYLTWTPMLQCTDGSFTGSDCSGAGIPTDQAGTTCVPVTDGNVDGGQPMGTAHFVTIN